MRTITANNSPFKITVNKLTLGMGGAGCLQEGGGGKKKKRGPDGDGDCRGAAAALTYNRHAQTHAHTSADAPPRKSQRPPPTHRRTHGEAATEALSRPSFCLEKFAYVSMHRQRGEHVLNGDRGEVDYTVSTGDLMTDTHGAPPPPQQMMGITRSRRMRTQRASVASLNLYKLRVTVENPIF